MGDPIKSTPKLKGDDADKFMKAAFDPPKLNRGKILTQRQVDKIVSSVKAQQKK